MPSYEVEPTTIDRLRPLWRAVLYRDDIAAEDDFFDLGGDSLAAVEVINRVNAELGVALETIVLFDHPTLAELAALIERSA
jgi:phthiocerol/phenolphthiocerol synthesis type-I polyketide synthase E